MEERVNSKNLQISLFLSISSQILAVSFFLSLSPSLSQFVCLCLYLSLFHIFQFRHMYENKLQLAATLISFVNLLMAAYRYNERLTG